MNPSFSRLIKNIPIIKIEKKMLRKKRNFANDLVNKSSLEYLHNSLDRVFESDMHFSSRTFLPRGINLSTLASNFCAGGYFESPGASTDKILHVPQQPRLFY